jgi:hypothetical protein
MYVLTPRNCEKKIPMSKTVVASDAACDVVHSREEPLDAISCARCF